MSSFIGIQLKVYAGYTYTMYTLYIGNTDTIMIVSDFEVW